MLLIVKNSFDLLGNSHYSSNMFLNCLVPRIPLTLHCSKKRNYLSKILQYKSIYFWIMILKVFVTVCIFLRLISKTNFTQIILSTWGQPKQNSTCSLEYKKLLLLLWFKRFPWGNFLMRTSVILASLCFDLINKSVRFKLRSTLVWVIFSRIPVNYAIIC